MTKYTYRRLAHPERSIRLLEIIPGAQDDPIKCIVSTYRRSIYAAYNALSYAWGDESEKVPISLNGEEFYVTSNLEGALRNLRCRTEEEWDMESPTLFWIDAICIDQCNFEERNQQVQRMKDIYEQAQTVIVYLGNHWEKCDDRLDPTISNWAGGTFPRGTDELTAKASILCSDLSDTPLHPSIKKNFPRLAESHLSGPMMYLDIEAWVQLSRIFHRPWFERLWIIQELAVSTNTAFQCGRVRERWELLETAAAKILRPDFSLAPSIENILPWIGAHRMTQVAVTKLIDFDKSNILTVLRHTQKAKCLNPRDKLYAVLGVVHDDEAMSVDYESSVESVYRNWATERIRRLNKRSFLDLMFQSLGPDIGGVTVSRGLDILTACADLGRTDDLPSWVPDLTRPWAQDKHLWNWAHYLAPARRNELQARNHNNWSRIPLQPQATQPKGLESYWDNSSFSSDGLQLTINGHLKTTITALSSIGDVTSSLEDPSKLTHALGSVISSWEVWSEAQKADLSMASFATELHFTEALLRGGLLTESDLSITTIYNYWRCRGHGKDQARANVYRLHTLSEVEQNRIMRSLESQLFSMVHDSRMFMTEDAIPGVVAGNCDVHVGDQIWFLAGALTPSILRLVDGGHRFITPCYWQNNYYYLHGDVRIEDMVRQSVTLT